MGLPILTPLDGDGTFGLFIEDKGIWSCCNFGGGNLGGVGEFDGGGGGGGRIGFLSLWGFDVSRFEGVIETEYPSEGGGGFAIEIQSYLYWKLSNKKDTESRTRLYGKPQTIQSQTES